MRVDAEHYCMWVVGCASCLSFMAISSNGSCPDESTTVVLCHGDGVVPEARRGLNMAAKSLGYQGSQKRKGKQ